MVLACFYSYAIYASCEVMLTSLLPKIQKEQWLDRKKYILTDCYEYVPRKAAEILMVQPHPSVAD